MEKIIFFVYINSSKRFNAYTLHSPSESKNGKYIQGINESTGSYLTFRKDRILKYFDNYADAKSEINSLISTTDLSSFEFPSKSKNTNQVTFTGTHEICFTGFLKADRDRLENLALNAGMIVRKDVTANLHLLCCGYNAGQKKMELARTKGTIILDENQLLNLIEYGELPENV